VHTNSSGASSGQFQSPWSVDNSSFSSTDSTFKPVENVGVQNIPAFISADSRSVDFFSLMWDDSVWDLICIETNRQAEFIKEEKPNNYGAKHLFLSQYRS
jgi:hypothetical protein